ncbi:MAG: hypothetical protein WD851_22585 [Pirellulales bacterium]
MRIRSSALPRQLRLEALETRCLLSGQTWNMASDFASSFVGGLPQNNPNGVWAYYGSDGTTTSLQPTNGTSPSTFGVGAGWAEADGIPSYARGGVFGFPAQSIAGHGPNHIVWTAPTELDLGGVEISGIFTQAPFEPTRQMQLRIYKNDVSELIAVNANFAVQSTIVTLPTTQIAMQPGDTLNIYVDGTGPQGNGVSTFSAWNVIIQEVGVAGDYNGNGVVDAADYTVWRDSYGRTGTPGQIAGDGTTTSNLNGIPDGVVDPWDFAFWRLNYGETFDPGGTPISFQPAAIIVQTSGVTLPDGTLLDISTSQTQGIQEAFNLSAEQGWDVFVLPGAYTLNAHLDIEELQLRTFRFEDAVFNFTSNVTDFGIRFDSTMMVNWYWKGGAINAPSATHGVLFQPRTPHPLDGQKFGTIGVVDSRFHFNVDITAGTNRVTMNSLQATINDIAFQFKDILPNQIHYIGGGFAGYNIFEPARLDDPIPFDLFNTAGRVTVVPPLSDISAGIPGTVWLPDGSRLNVSNTQTFGLQEAFDYAAAHDLDVLVFGRGVRNVAPTTNLGLYNLTASLEVGDLADRMYRIYGVTFNFPVAEEDALILGDVVDSDFELTGQVVAYTSENAIIIRPDGPGVQNSVIRIQAMVGSNNTFNTNVRIDPSLASIQNSQFLLHEVNTGYFGIKVMNPSATTEFSGNLIQSLHTHAAGHIGVQLGENSTNAAQIHFNTVIVRTNTDGVPAAAAAQVWGHSNTLNLYALNSGLSFGVKFEPSSANNILYYGFIQAATPIADAGTNNSYIAIGAGEGSLAVQGDSLGGNFANVESTGDQSGPLLGTKDQADVWLIDDEDNDPYAAAFAALAEESEYEETERDAWPSVAVAWFPDLAA